MKLPKLKYKDNVKRYEQINFSGIDRRKAAQDGSLYDLKDISADGYPILSTINNRYVDESKYENPWYYGMADKPFVIAGNQNGKNYPNWQQNYKYYYAGNIVAWGGKLYECTVSTNNVSDKTNTEISEPAYVIAMEPPYAPGYWREYNKTSFQYDGVYNLDVNCIEGEVFICNNNFYRCLKTHTASGNINDGNWEPYRYASLYYGGKKVEGLELIPGKKECVYLNDHIIIFPDKMYYNVYSGEYGYLKGVKNGTFDLYNNKLAMGRNSNYSGFFSSGTWSGRRSLDWYLCNSSGVINGQSGKNDVLRLKWTNLETTGYSIHSLSYALFDLRNYFKPGDVINIQQADAWGSSEIVDGYHFVRDVGFDYLRFDSQRFSGTTFVSGYEYNHIDSNVQYWAVEGLVITKEIPDMDYLCNIDNRIWGCKDDTVYASGLGNPFSWQSYTGLETDAVYLEAGTIDKFTGCCAYGGYPYFFKENEMYRVYGSTASEFNLYRVADIGIKKGAAHSVCSVNSILMFLSPKGIYAYTGGVPGEVSGNLNDFIYDCIASTDGLKYYGVMTVGDEKRLYVYDAVTGMWSSEHFEGEALGFAWYENDLRCMNSEGKIFTVSRPTGKYGTEIKEITDKALIEFNDFYGGSIGTKDIGRFIIRASVDPEYNALYIYVQYDSDGIWHQVGKIYNQNTRKKVCEFGFFPRKCDHFRIKLECQGKFTLYSMAREITNNG